MYAKEMTYEDFDGNSIKETFYFNITAAEMLELQKKVPDELKTSSTNPEEVTAAVANISGDTMIDFLKLLIAESYGCKSADGKRFVKNALQTTEFTQTQAYSDFLLLLCTDEKELEEFTAKVMPSQFISKAREILNNKTTNLTIK